MDNSTQTETYRKVMKELQDEWKGGQELFEEVHFVDSGIRSSQIAALVALLVKKGILND